MAIAAKIRNVGQASRRFLPDNPQSHRFNGVQRSGRCNTLLKELAAEPRRMRRPIINWKDSGSISTFLKRYVYFPAPREGTGISQARGYNL